jgi:hypothetical protein
MLIPGAMLSRIAARTGRLPDRWLSRDFRVRLGICVSVLSRQAKHGAGFGYQGIGIEGFGHVQVSADFLAALTIELLAFRREKNDVDVLQTHLIFYGITNIEAILLGHHYIEEDKVWFFPADRLERLLAIGGGEQVDPLVFEFLESLLDQRAQMWFVVNDKDLHSFH